MVFNTSFHLIRFSIILFCVCLIRCDTSEEVLQRDFEIKPEFLDGIEKLRTMIFEDIRLSDDILSNEIIKDFMMTLKSCQKGLDKAADKVTYLLDLLSEDEMPERDEGEEEEEDDGVYHTVGEENYEDSVLVDEFSGSYTSEEETTVLQENYVKEIRRVFKTLTHACNSLPKTLPRIHSRKQRNPQTTAQRLAISLKRWAEKWLNLVEVRLEDFLVTCMKDENCEHYFHKVIKMVVDILEEYQFYLDKNTLSILHDFQEDKGNPSMDTMNYIQRASLKIGDSFGSFKEDDSSYHIANGVHDNKLDDNWLNFGVEGNDGLKFLSNVFHEVRHKTAPNAIVEIDEEKIVQKVPKTFVSAAFGTSVIQDGWREVKTQKDKFLKIASALSPALFRVGGSGANFLTYDPLSSFETNYIKGNSPQLVPFGAQHPKGYSTRRKRNGNRFPRKIVRDTLKRPMKGVRNQYMIETNKLTLDMDHTFDFEEICEVQNEVGKVFTNFTMTREDYKLLIDIVRQLDWPLIWDLNQFWRDPNGHWDPTNAKLIIDDPYSSEVPIIWQIGNEPNNYAHHFNWSIKPEEAVKDYKYLNELVRSKNNNGASQKPLIIGPDVTRPRLDSEKYDLKEDSMDFLESFLEKGVNEIDVVTWHQYYLDGRKATLKDFLSPELLNAFPKELNVVVSMKNRLAPEKPIWITETATAWGGGAPELSPSFAACFPWLDKLGAAAFGGVDVVFRQTLYGGCYALLDDQLTPYPDFWASVLHKRIMGQEVLLPRVRLAKDSLRIYAHCLEHNHPLKKQGAIVIVILNLSKEEELVQLIGKSLKSSPKYLYELSAPDGNLLSRNILLNKEMLKLNDDGSLPNFKPILIETEDLLVSPWTINFWVITEAEYQVCSK